MRFLSYFFKSNEQPLTAMKPLCKNLLDTSYNSIIYIDQFVPYLKRTSSFSLLAYRLSNKPINVKFHISINMQLWNYNLKINNESIVSKIQYFKLCQKTITL